MFIAYLKHYRESWAQPSTQEELQRYGLEPQPSFPDTSGLRFVQLDEFMPMHPEHKNSFTHYVRSLYLPVLDIKPENVLTMDFVAAGVLPSDAHDYDAIFENGIALCGIEKAWKDGAVKFRKPISCHLYPIRVAKLAGYEGLNYHKWPICKPACTCGAKLDVPVYRFLKDALVRAYGQEWYDELEVIHEAWLAEPKRKK